ncbi:MAG TPA: tetratricopeptide repeat protein [Chthoniobacterales bacterium]
MRDLFSELKRRNVYKVAVAYGVVGWLVIQVTSTIVPALHLPDTLTTAIVVIVLIGFPIALAIAWTFEMTPEGLKRTENVSPDQHLPQWSRRKFGAFVIGLSIIAAGLLAYQLLKPKFADIPVVEETIKPKPVPQKSIAVLPFENLSDDKSAAYFADGIQDEILTKLASVADLKVISRTSTAKYKSKPEDLKVVSRQLGVAHVLEGTVQKAGEKVRVNVQLIDARADSHLWAKSYDRDMKDVFAVESEVAQEIADSLQAKLSPAEANTLASAPTNDPEAYDLFLKGEFEARLATSNLRPESYDQATAWYQQAIARDPNFALAIARLAENRILRHWFVEFLSEADLVEVRKTVESALAIAPNLAEAHIALGMFYYHGHRQYDAALAEFSRAIQLQPNNAQVLEYLGYVHRRQGKWAQSLEEHQKALVHDPRNATLEANMSSSYLHLRMYKESAAAARHAIRVDPYETIGMRSVLLSILNGRGDIDEALRALATFPADSKLTSNSLFGSVASIVGERAYALVIARKFEDAIKVWESQPTNDVDQRRAISARVALRVLAGNATGAQTEAQKALKILEDRARERPNEILTKSELSWVYLALNRKDDALSSSRKAAQLLPPEQDALIGDYNLTGLAEIEARTGEAADAVSIIKQLLSIPAGDSISIARLKIDPVWDPIRNDPSFQKLLTEKELIGPGD